MLQISFIKCKILFAMKFRSVFTEWILRENIKMKGLDYIYGI